MTIQMSKKKGDPISEKVPFPGTNGTKGEKLF